MWFFITGKSTFCRVSGNEMNNLLTIPYNEFNHLTLLDCLKDYRYPKDRITKLLKKKEIIQIRKGLYILGPEYRKGYLSKEILANMIYGPSYISLEYALSFYNLIPERVEVVTSVTPKRKKTFDTEIGTFIYYTLNFKYYHFGYTTKRMKDGRNFLIATPEKAIADKIYFEKSLKTPKQIFEFLTENLRIEKADLKNLDLVSMEKMVSAYNKRKMYNILKALTL